MARWPWSRGHTGPEEIRPRFGEIRRRDGTTEPLVFHPTSDPLVFEARLAGSECRVAPRPGDEFTVDVLGPGQSVVV